MSIAEIIPLVENLSHTDKFQLIRLLLKHLTWEECLSIQLPIGSKDSQGETMANILQRMADRQSLSHITDPIAWQQEIRTDRHLQSRE